MKKYELTSEIKNYIGHKLYRIRALKDFGSVKAGDLGGWVESKENLSQYETAWVFDEAKVYGNAYVSDCAKVHDNACICGYATICGNAKVFENAEICGHAEIYDRATIHEYAKVYDCAQICGKANIHGYAVISGNTFVSEKADIYGDINIRGYIDIRGDAKVFNESDYIVFKNFWSSGRYFTWTRYNNMWKVGCFYGTGEELIKKAYADSEESCREYERVVKYVQSILADEKKEKHE